MASDPASAVAVEPVPARLGPVAGTREFVRFLGCAARHASRGSLGYWAWIGLLVAMVVTGVVSYVHQAQVGLISTSMRDQVSWGFYIGNFTFLVGVAAAAVLLVIPAYVYHWKPIKEVAILGELLAIAAISMCSLFVLADVGRPDRVWHLFPFVGSLHVPQSLLAWDVLVLNTYLFLNLGIVTYLLFSFYRGTHPRNRFFAPLVLLSIPVAIGIHTVTAFLYNGLASRPFWNASILAPRFLASAFCSGPAVLIVLMQILRRVTRFEISNTAIWKVAELMAYAMALNLFLFGAEAFKEVYSATEHRIHFEYMFLGVQGHTELVPFMWFALFASVAAFVLFLVPRTRRNPVTLNLGCALIFLGVYIEKGMGLVIPGQTPDTLGDIYAYTPSLTEVGVTLGIFGVGGLILTVLVKAAIPIVLGEPGARSASAVPAEEVRAGAGTTA